MINLLIFSHLDYIYLWDIIDDYVEKLKDLNPIFISNKNNNQVNIKKPKNFIKYIEYDDNKPYFMRFDEDILPYIYSEYILIVHDVHLIINCNVNFIHKIVLTMNNNNIDRFSMNVFNGNDIIIENDITICNLKNAIGFTYNIYDVCPTIWNKDSYKYLVNNFYNKTYNFSEQCPDVKQFCIDNFNIYGIQKITNNIYYCLGRPYSYDFTILFLTIRGKIVVPYEVYMDGLDEFNKIKLKYNIIDRINKFTDCSFIIDNFKLL